MLVAARPRRNRRSCRRCTRHGACSFRVALYSVCVCVCAYVTLAHACTCPVHLQSDERGSSMTASHAPTGVFLCLRDVVAKGMTSYTCSLQRGRGATGVAAGGARETVRVLSVLHFRGRELLNAHNCLMSCREVAKLEAAPQPIGLPRSAH